MFLHTHTPTLSISCEVASASKGSHNRVESCIHDMYGHRAVVIVDDILATSGLFLQRISRYDVGDKGEHLLEDICNISVARLLRAGL
jgi:hypothetical protein